VLFLSVGRGHFKADRLGFFGRSCFDLTHRFDAVFTVEVALL